MTSAGVLLDCFGRIRDATVRAVEGLTPDDLAYRADPESNSIAWLVWHLTRVQDDHVAEVAGAEQQWTAAGWKDDFGLPLEAADTGYEHRTSQVAEVTSDADLLRRYHLAVYEQTCAFVQGVTDSELERVVDHRWNPPVTLGVRLVSVVEDSFQHVGQAAFVRGLVERRRPTNA